MAHDIPIHGTPQRTDSHPIRWQLRSMWRSTFKRLITGVTACALALVGFVVVDASIGSASDVEGIYDLTTTNASGNVDPIPAVNSFRVFIKPASTTTQFQVSFDTGTVTYSLNGSSGSLTSGVPSAPLSVPIGESDLVLTYTNSLSEQSVYHVYLKRPIEITSMWFEGTTVSSPTNFDSSTTVTVPLTPVWDANATGHSPGFSVSVPHGVVKGRLVWTYSRVGEQNVTQYSIDYDTPPGTKVTNFNYDSVAKTGTATSGWHSLPVGNYRWLVYSGTVIPSGDANLVYAVNVTRGPALSSDAVSALALNDTSASLSTTSALYTWQAIMPPATTSTHVNATFASGSATWSMNGQSGSLTSGVDSAAISVPIGESDLSVTHTPVSGPPIVYHVLIKRPIQITSMWFEGTTVASPANFDSSTTVTVPLTPVWDANASGHSPGYSVSVPHGVVKGRLVWTYSRVGEQNVTQYSIDYDTPPGTKVTNFNYDSVAKTGTATSGWHSLPVGNYRWLVYSGTVIPSGDANLVYAVNVTRGPALSSDAVSALALNDTSASLSTTSALYTWQAIMPPATTSTHVNATFASGSATWSMNGQSGSLTSGVDSAAISVPIGESDLSVTYTPVTGPSIVYHIFVKRPIEITSMWFEGTTVSSPTNFDSSTTVTVPLTPVWDANASGYSPGYSVSVPHGVVKGRLVWTYSRVGEQNVTQYSIDYDAPAGTRVTNFNYDAVAQTGTATSGWGTLDVGSNRYLVFSGTVIPSGDANLAYAVYVTRRAATVVPGPPLVRAAEPVNATSALVSWDPPASDGGEAIQSYTVSSNQVIAPQSVSARSTGRFAQTISVASVEPGTCVTTTTTCVVTGLVTGASYTFSVIATNVNGNSPTSVATSAITILVAPDAPTAVSAVAGVNSASVSWAAPAVDGGSAITGYRVTSSPDGLTCQPQSLVTLSCDVTGLTNGTNYTFTVVAINAIGTSAASSASNSVTPTAPTPSTTVPPVTTTVPPVTTTVPPVTTTVPPVTTTVPAPSESVVLDLPEPSQPLLTDTALVVGEEVSLEFDGFVPGEDVLLIVASNPQTIASGRADSAGRIRLSGSLPSNLASGGHNLALYAPVSGRGVRQPITVEQVNLPATGMGRELKAQLLLALLVTTIGMCQVVPMRRRSRSR